MTTEFHHPGAASNVVISYCVTHESTWNQCLKDWVIISAHSCASRCRSYFDLPGHHRPQISSAAMEAFAASLFFMPSVWGHLAIDLTSLMSLCSIAIVNAIEAFLYMTHASLPTGFRHKMDYGDHLQQS